jgi:hypothetical protein
MTKCYDIDETAAERDRLKEVNAALLAALALAISEFNEHGGLSCETTDAMNAAIAKARNIIS